MLLLYTEIRVSECVGMLLKDIDFMTLYLTVEGKGSKMRTIPLKHELVVIKEYLES